MEDLFSIYLLFSEDNFDNLFSEHDHFLESIKIMIQRADCEKQANLYYSKTNLENFIANIITLHQEFPNELANRGTLKIGTVIKRLLAKAENWEEKPHFSAQNFYGQWDSDSPNNVNDEISDVLKEMTEKIIIEKDTKFLLLNMYRAFPYYKDYLTIFVDKKESKIAPIFVWIEKANNLEGLEKWFEENRTSKILNIEDERHQEWSGKFKKESPLLYDLRNTENQKIVQNLLNTSLTDQREPERANKDLINFDKIKGCYIWFEYENSQNGYHAYHLVFNKYAQKSHERDEKAESKIPQRVKDILEYRKKNF